MFDVSKYVQQLDAKKKVFDWIIDGRYVHGISISLGFGLSPKTICENYNISLNHFYPSITEPTMFSLTDLFVVVKRDAAHVMVSPTVFTSRDAAFLTTKQNEIVFSLEEHLIEVSDAASSRKD